MEEFAAGFGRGRQNICKVCTKLDGSFTMVEGIT